MLSCCSASLVWTCSERSVRSSNIVDDPSSSKLVVSSQSPVWVQSISSMVNDFLFSLPFSRKKAQKMSGFSLEKRDRISCLGVKARRVRRSGFLASPFTSLLSLEKRIFDGGGALLLLLWPFYPYSPFCLTHTAQVTRCAFAASSLICVLYCVSSTSHDHSRPFFLLPLSCVYVMCFFKRYYSRCTHCRKSRNILSITVDEENFKVSAFSFSKLKVLFSSSH